MVHKTGKAFGSYSDRRNFAHCTVGLGSWSIQLNTISKWRSCTKGRFDKADSQTKQSPAFNFGNLKYQNF